MFFFLKCLDRKKTAAEGKLCASNCRLNNQSKLCCYNDAPYLNVLHLQLTFTGLDGVVGASMFTTGCSRWWRLVVQWVLTGNVRSVASWENRCRKVSFWLLKGGKKAEREGGRWRGCECCRWNATAWSFRCCRGHVAVPNDGSDGQKVQLLEMFQTYWNISPNLCVVVVVVFLFFFSYRNNYHTLDLLLRYFKILILLHSC